jgi:hypothetical protein
LKRLALALLFVAGAAHAQIAVTPARTEAAGYAVTHALLVVNLVKNCEPYAGEIGLDPAAALAGWRQRNAERVGAAQAYFVFARSAIEREHGAAAGEQFHARTQGVFIEQANTTLNDIFGPAGPQQDVCRRWVSAIVTEKADLNWQSKYMPLLDELVEFARGVDPRR